MFRLLGNCNADYFTEMAVALSSFDNQNSIQIFTFEDNYKFQIRYVRAEAETKFYILWLASVLMDSVWTTMNGSSIPS